MNDSHCNLSTCQHLQPLLVDYADERLNAGDKNAQLVRQHVASCRSCRRRIDALHQSLALAQDVWQESVATMRQPIAAPTVASDAARPVAPRWAWASGGLAATVILLACWLALAPGPPVARRSPEKGVPRVQQSDGEKMVSQNEVSFEDLSIEEYIHREEQAARLKMSLTILADTPNADHDLARAKEYLQATYATASTDQL